MEIRKQSGESDLGLCYDVQSIAYHPFHPPLVLEVERDLRRNNSWNARPDAPDIALCHAIRARFPTVNAIG